MNLDEQLYEKIQQYLNNELTGKALQDFEAELQSNPNLAREVALHREMEDFLADTPENDLRKNLQTLNARFTDDTDKSEGDWKFLFLLLPFFLIGAWYVYNQVFVPNHPERNNSINFVSPDKDTFPILKDTFVSIPQDTTAIASNPIKPIPITTPKASSEKPKRKKTPKKPNTPIKTPPTINKSQPTEDSIIFEPIAESSAPSVIPEPIPEPIPAPSEIPEPTVVLDSPSSNIENTEPQLAEWLDVPIDPKTNQAYEIFEFDTIIYTSVDENGFKPKDTLIIKGDATVSNFIFSKIDSLAKDNNWVIQKQLSSVASIFSYQGLSNLDTFFEKFTRPDFQHKTYQVDIEKNPDHYTLSSPKDSVLLNIEGNIRHLDSSPMIYSYPVNIKIFPSGIAEYRPIYKDLLTKDCIDWYTCRFQYKKPYHLKPGTYYLVLIPQGQSSENIMFAQKIIVSQ